MITRISKKPEIVFNFSKHPDTDHIAGDVLCVLSVHISSRNMDFRSEGLYLDRSQWDKESIDRLEDLTAKISELRQAMEECERQAHPLTTEQPIWDKDSLERLEELNIGKLQEAVEECERRAPPLAMEQPIWDKDSLERLEELTANIGKLQEAMEECERRTPLWCKQFGDPAPLTMEQPIKRLSQEELEQRSTTFREWGRKNDIAKQALRIAVADKRSLEAERRRLWLEQRKTAWKGWYRQTEIAKQALRIGLAEKGSLEAKIGTLWREQRATARQESSRQTEIAKQALRIGLAEKGSLEAQMGSSCIRQISLRAISLRNQNANERSYVLYRGAVWCSDRDLQPEQWQILADRFLDREDAELAAALAGSKPGLSRERITPEVRNAVWFRDKGKCARCESRERLEYDHIVPVSRGGSNTERNIELLCEVCNRSKSNRVE